MNVLRIVSLVAATVGMGLMAGVFGLYANVIMPGLGSTDDRTFVGAFQSIDRAVINPVFLGVFVGTLVTTGATAALHAFGDSRAPLPWAIAAFVLYLVVVVSTVAVNVPLNDAIKAAGPPDGIADLNDVRRRFDEAKWTRWNVARTLLSIAAFVCLAWALVEHGG